MSALRDLKIDELIEREGDYSDRPADSGGPTRFGITEAVARQWGYDGDMRELPRSIAETIYIRLYWNALGLDEIEPISEGLVEELFDSGVNVGTRRAARWLQQSLNALNDRERLYRDLVVDGHIGPMTRGALRTYHAQRGDRGLVVLLRMLNSLQGAFYIDLAERRPKDEEFVFGWFLNRVSMPTATMKPIADHD